MMKKKRLLALSLATIMGMSTLGNTISTVHAAESDISIVSEFTEDIFNQNFTMSEDELRNYGLSDSEIKQFNNFALSGINVANGNVSGSITSEEISSGAQTRGKFSAAVKLIRKTYKKLPKQVKSFIAKYTKLDILLNLIEHYTGTLEDAIYNACCKVGMPKNVANFVTKTIMLFVF